MATRNREKLLAEDFAAAEGVTAAARDKEAVLQTQLDAAVEERGDDSSEPSEGEKQLRVSWKRRRTRAKTQAYVVSFQSNLRHHTKCIQLGSSPIPCASTHSSFGTATPAQCDTQSMTSNGLEHPTTTSNCKMNGHC